MCIREVVKSQMAVALEREGMDEDRVKQFMEFVNQFYNSV